MSTTKSYPRHWLGAHKAHLATGCVTMTGISDGTSATAGQYRSRQAASRPSSLTPVLVWVVLLVLAAIAWAVNRIPGPEHDAFPPLAAPTRIGARLRPFKSVRTLRGGAQKATQQDGR